MQLSKNRKIFANFFLHFLNLHKILNTWEKKMNLRGYFFSEIIGCKERGYLND